MQEATAGKCVKSCRRQYKSTRLMFRCENPECRKLLDADGALVGRKVKCPVCSKPVGVSPSYRQNSGENTANSNEEEFATETGDVIAVAPLVMGDVEKSIREEIRSYRTISTDLL